MAHFEQASLLATAWANTDGVKERALQHSIVQVSKNNKIKRSRIPSGCLVVGLTISVWKEYLRCFFCICCSSRWLEAELGCDRAGDQTLRAQTIACYVWTGSAPIFLFSPSKRPRFLQHLWHCWSCMHGFFWHACLFINVFPHGDNMFLHMHDVVICIKVLGQNCMRKLRWDWCTRSHVWLSSLLNFWDLHASLITAHALSMCCM